MLDLLFVGMYLALGAFVGVAAGLLGIGGGIIMVPILTSIFALQGFPSEQIMHIALGTSMASILVTSCSSTLSHHRRGGVDWHAARVLGAGALVGTFAGTFLAAVMATKALSYFFAGFMSLVVLQMLLGIKPKPQRQLPSPPLLFSVGSGIGGISSLVSIGGGSMTVPYLTWCNFPMARAIGTSAALGMFISVSGTVGFFVNGWGHSSTVAHTLGYVYWPAVVLMSVFSFLTAPIGAKLAHSLPVPVLKKVFAVLVIVIVVKMLVVVN